jgi:arsenate reductase
MLTHRSEILLFYNPSSSSDRMTVAHALALTHYVKAYAYDQFPSKGLSWYQILEALDIPPKDLLNKSHPYYQHYIRGRDFDVDGWVNILRHNPEMIKAPIAVRGDKAVQCLTPTDIYKLSAPSTSPVSEEVA